MDNRTLLDKIYCYTVVVVTGVAVTTLVIVGLMDYFCRY